MRKQSLRAILACVQVSTSQGEAPAAQGATTTSAVPPPGTPGPATAAAPPLGTPATAAAPPSALAADLYAFIVFVHKHCNSDLFEAVGALELTLTQIKLLHHLEDQERELTLKEAADLVLISLPAASRTVEDLVRRGFVERREDLDDRRMKRVTLTDSGRSVIRRLNDARLSGMEQFTQTLNEAERPALANALKMLLERPEVAACRPEGPSLD